MKRTLSLIMTAIMIFSLTTIFAFGTEEDQSITVNKTSDGIRIENTTKGDVFIPDEDIDSTMAISEETASNIAKFFIRDIILSQDTNWNVSTAVKNIVPLYSIDESTVNAYSIELTDGYIVVSAFLDAPSLIYEWSDSAEPLYKQFDNIGHVLFFSNDEYYNAADHTVYDLYGNIIDKDGLVDYCQIERSVNNIPISVIEKVALRYLNTSNGSKSPIVDPFEYAN